jgi:hypothetical protein
MKYNRLTRRMFLQSGSGALLAIPFLNSLLPREAWGQTATAPKRFISMFSAFEVGHNSNWLPRIGGSTTNLPQPNRVLNVSDHSPVRWQPLNEFISSGSTPLAPLYGTSLNPYLQHVNIMRGLDIMYYFGHGAGHALGALNNSDLGLGALTQIQTIDNVLAANARINPNRRLFYAGAPGGWEGVSITSSGAQSTRIEWLDQLYNNLFDNGNYPQGNTTTQPTAHPKRDVLSRVIEDFNRVRSSRNISALDRNALSDAMDKMSDVHRGLAGLPTVPSSCSHSGISRPTGVYVSDIASSEQHSRVLVDMIVASIMCDSARIFTLGLNMPYHQYSGFTDPDFNYVGDWHQDISHNPFNITNGRRNWEWVGRKQAYIISRIFAPLVQRLSSAIDPANGQSYLYNSLIHNTYESGQLHGHISQPTILAGNAGGALTTGNYIDYSDRSKGAINGAHYFNTDPSSPEFSNDYVGVNYNRVLVTMLQAMGLSPSEYERNLLQQVHNRTDIGSQNANLTNIGGYGYAFNVDRNLNHYDVANSFSKLRNYDLPQFRNRLPTP